jgi:TonB family protein
MQAFLEQCMFTFVINKEGKVSNAEVKRGVKGGPGLDKEALRVIQNMPSLECR